MIEDFVLVSDSREIEQKYGVKNFYPGLTIPVPKVLSVSDKFWTITFDTPGYIIPMRYGYNQEYSQDSELTLNTYLEDPSEYFINSRLVTKSSPKRCIVIVDAFLVKTRRNEKYLIHFENRQRAKGLAATYSYWNANNSGEPNVGFAIFTVPSSPMLQKIGISEMPVIISNEDTQIWLGEDFRPREIVRLFNSNNDELLNGYPVKNNISSGPISKDHIQPTGKRLKPIAQNSIPPTLRVLKNVNQKNDLNNNQNSNVIHLK